MVINKKLKITIVSNVSVHALKDCVEKKFSEIDVFLGNYDNILQDVTNLTKDNIVIVFFEAINIISDLEFKLDLLSNEEYQQFLNETKQKISLLCKKLIGFKLVLFNKFSANYLKTINHKTRWENFISCLNEHLISNMEIGSELIDIENIFKLISIPKSIDLRFYNLTKTLYSIEFFEHYVSAITPYIEQQLGIIKKVLIVDCDNTLWKGILGEDGIENLEFYSEVQYTLKLLSKQGILICICSKNNEDDVLKVFKERNDMILKLDDIIDYRINWNNKASNITEMIKNLNLGLQSVVFIDDSQFEIALIKDKIPEVTTILVSKHRYKRLYQMLELRNIFNLTLVTEEDNKKNDLYKKEILRNKEKIQYQNIEDYLKSLNICLEILAKEENNTKRLAQLTQKTNQFNLTTRRYSESEIINLNQSSQHILLSGRVIDKYGDSGITVFSIIEFKNEEEVFIDTFLMSCRVLGREIEKAFICYIIEYLKKLNIKKIYSQFRYSEKNQQVMNFYDQLGFKIITQNKTLKDYELDIESFNIKKVEYIEIKYKK